MPATAKREPQMTEAAKPAPLRKIVERPSLMKERLECGHVVSRVLGLGEDATRPAKAKSRRCFFCADEAPATLSKSGA